MAATLMVYGYYFARVFSAPRPSEFDHASLIHLVAAVFVLVVIEVVYHIAISMISKAEPKDERDIQIEGKAYRIAYFLLVADLFMLMGTLVLFGLTPFLTVNLMLFSVVVSEVVKSFTQVVCYRRGI